MKRTVTSIIVSALLSCAAGSAVAQQPTIVYLGGPLGTPVLIDPDRTHPVPLAVPLGQLNGLRWSRDGSLITAEGVDLRQQGATTQIFNFDRAGNVVPVTTLAVSGYPVLKLFSAFSPQGDKMAVTARFLGQESQQGLLFIYSKGSAWTLAGTVGTLNAACSSCGIDQLGTGWGVDWSPHSDLVITPLENLAACPGSALPAVFTEIYSAPPAPGASFTQITTSSRDAACAAGSLVQFWSVLPVFSPDGATIAYVQWARGTSLQSTIRLVSLDGTNDRPIVSLPAAQVFALDWSPDGTQLIYDQMPIVNGVPDFPHATVSVVRTDGGGGPTLFLSAPAAQPAWSRQFPLPGLATIAPAQVAAGSGPLTLTVKGTNFTSSSIVQWNGALRATTFQSPESLQAAIPASDLAQPGAAQVTVFNPTPGGGTSSAAPFTITVTAAPAVALSTKTVTFAPQLVGAASTPQSITVTNSGAAPLSISAVAVTKNGGDIGSFAETDHCVGSVAVGASCAITLTFQATGVGAASGTLSITDNAADTPQTVALAGVGADFSFAAAPGASLTDTVVAGQTATYHLVVQPSGYSGTVSLACGGAPPGASCSPSATGLEVSATAPAPFTISVATAARSQMTARTSGSSPLRARPIALGPWLVALALLAMLVALDAVSLRRWAHVPAAVILLCAPGCGSGNSPTGPGQPIAGTPGGSYTLVVTAAAGDVRRTINLALDVK